MFNKDFLWGVATAAPQIEGCSYKGNKGETIWDLNALEHRIFHNQTLEDSPCSYLYLDEDIKLIKELGVKVYRFSIAWTRIIPNGIDSEINIEGVNYYNKLINSLLEIGVIPYVTIFHWDLPLNIYNKGGYSNNEFPKWFKHYTEVLLNLFGDRVKHWITLNEPQCILGGMSDAGQDKKYSDKENIIRYRNLLLAHYESYKAIKEYDKNNKVGIAFVCGGFIPFNRLDDNDILAAKKATFNVDDKFNVWNLALYSDPILLGKFPSNFINNYKNEIKEIFLDLDLNKIHTSLDFFGINNYASRLVIYSNNKEGFIEKEWDSNVCHTKGYQWAFSPEGLYYLSKFIYERYNIPLIVTENGCCNYDIICRDGKIHDNLRIEYLASYLDNLEKAYKEGVDIKGYFCWSLLDNLEWYMGTSERFGLVYTDFVTKKRTPKESFYFYKDIIKNQK